jgi:hypothetical protein
MDWSAPRSVDVRDGVKGIKHEAWQEAASFPQKSEVCQIRAMSRDMCCRKTVNPLIGVQSSLKGLMTAGDCWGAWRPGDVASWVGATLWAGVWRKLWRSEPLMDAGLQCARDGGEAGNNQFGRSPDISHAMQRSNEPKFGIYASLSGIIDVMSAMSLSVQ